MIFDPVPPERDWFRNQWMSKCWITGCNFHVDRKDEVGLCPTHLEELRAHSGK